MKRFYIAVYILFTVAVLSGCLAAPNSGEPLLTKATPVATAIEKAPKSAATNPSFTPTQQVSTPEPERTASPTVCISKGFGLSFIVPDSWIGRYCVEERDDLLTVFFKPSTPLAENSWSGELFSIVKDPTKNEDIHPIEGEWEFTLNSETYVWGISDADAYDKRAPQSDIFLRMKNDIPNIFKSLVSLTNQKPENITRLWIETSPKNTQYATTMGLGLSFTLPEYWIGKCKIQETKDSISFYFTPKNPNAFDSGEGFLFSIRKKGDNSGESGYDGVREFTVNGTVYFAGGATDVEYEGSEDDVYEAMFDGIQDIIDSARDQ